MRIVKRLLEDGADVRVDKLYEDDEGRWSIRGNCLVLSTLLGQEYVFYIITFTTYRYSSRSFLFNIS